MLKQYRNGISQIEENVTYLRGYIRSPLSIPGVYDKKHANAVSNTKPKFKAQLRMP